MTETKTRANDLAYPFESGSSYVDEEGYTHKQFTQAGLTKREYFAAMAMQGILSTHENISAPWAAKESVSQAHALIEALNKGGGE